MKDFFQGLQKIGDTISQNVNTIKQSLDNIQKSTTSLLDKALEKGPNAKINTVAIAEWNLMIAKTKKRAPSVLDLLHLGLSPEALWENRDILTTKQYEDLMQFEKFKRTLPQSEAMLLEDFAFSLPRNQEGKTPMSGSLEVHKLKWDAVLNSEEVRFKKALESSKPDLGLENQTVSVDALRKLRDQNFTAYTIYRNRQYFKNFEEIDPKTWVETLLQAGYSLAEGDLRFLHAEGRISVGSLARENISLDALLGFVMPGGMTIREKQGVIFEIFRTRKYNPESIEGKVSHYSHQRIDRMMQKRREMLAGGTKVLENLTTLPSRSGFLRLIANRQVGIILAKITPLLQRLPYKKESDEKAIKELIGEVVQLVGDPAFYQDPALMQALQEEVKRLLLDKTKSRWFRASTGFSAESVETLVGLIPELLTQLVHVEGTEALKKKRMQEVEGVLFNTVLFLRGEQGLENFLGSVLLMVSNNSALQKVLLQDKKEAVFTFIAQVVTSHLKNPLRESLEKEEVQWLRKTLDIRKALVWILDIVSLYKELGSVEFNGKLKDLARIICTTDPNYAKWRQNFEHFSEYFEKRQPGVGFWARVRFFIKAIWRVFFPKVSRPMVKTWLAKNAKQLSWMQKRQALDTILALEGRHGPIDKLDTILTLEVEGRQGPIDEKGRVYEEVVRQVEALSQEEKRVLEEVKELDEVNKVRVLSDRIQTMISEKGEEYAWYFWRSVQGAIAKEQRIAVEEACFQQFESPTTKPRAFWASYLTKQVFSSLENIYEHSVLGENIAKDHKTSIDEIIGLLRQYDDFGEKLGSLFAKDEWTRRNQERERMVKTFLVRECFATQTPLKDTISDFKAFLENATENLELATWWNQKPPENLGNDKLHAIMINRLCEENILPRSIHPDSNLPWIGGVRPKSFTIGDSPLWGGVVAYLVHACQDENDVERVLEMFLNCVYYHQNPHFFASLAEGKKTGEEVEMALHEAMQCFRLRQLFYPFQWSNRIKGALEVWSKDENAHLLKVNAEGRSGLFHKKTQRVVLHGLSLFKPTLGVSALRNTKGG